MSLFQFKIRVHLPSKKNSYLISKKKTRSGKIRAVIYPSKAVLQAEKTIAWHIKINTRPKDLEGWLVVYAIINSRMDVDNAGGVIMDGVQKSGRVINDSLSDGLSSVRGKSKEYLYLFIKVLSPGDNPARALSRIQDDNADKVIVRN